MIDDTNKKIIDEANELAQIVTEAQIGIDILKKMEEQAKEILTVLDKADHGAGQTASGVADTHTEDAIDAHTADTIDTQTAVAAAQESAAAQVAEMIVDPSISARSEMTAQKSESVTIMPDSLITDASTDTDTNSASDTTDPIAGLVSNGN